MEKVQISYSVLINDSFEKNRMDGIYHHYQPLTIWTRIVRIWSGKFQYQMEHAAAISRLKPVICNLPLVVLLCDSSCLTSSTMRRRSSSRCTTTRCSGSAMCTTQHGFLCCFFVFFFCGYDFRFAVLWCSFKDVVLIEAAGVHQCRCPSVLPRHSGCNLKCEDV